MTTTETQLRALNSMTPLEHRFWAKVSIVDDGNSCWEWNGAIHPTGYGHFQWQPPGENKRRAVNAHRVALFLTTGAMPTIACHHCDNPPCCRPSHLYDGTHQSNGADKATRHRGRGKEQRGETNAYAKLTDELVLDARRRARQGESLESIALSYGVQRPTLSYAVLGRTWTHLNATEAPVRRR